MKYSNFLPSNTCFTLGQSGVNILGTRPEDIDRAEDRDKFSAMLDSIGVDQVGCLVSLVTCNTYNTFLEGRMP